jgi:hypothetical protein
MQQLGDDEYNAPMIGQVEDLVKPRRIMQSAEYAA